MYGYWSDGVPSVEGGWENPKGGLVVFGHGREAWRSRFESCLWTVKNLNRMHDGDVIPS